MKNLFRQAKIDFAENYWDEMHEMLSNPRVQEMKNFNQHGDTSCYIHSLRVSRYSYYLCKILKLEYMSAARGGMLHDLFLYDWQEQQMKGYTHLRNHAKTALNHAEEEFELNDMEKDIIGKHMFPVTYEFPLFWESALVSAVDKYCATYEAFEYLSRKTKCALMRGMQKLMRYANILLSATEY